MEIIKMAEMLGNPPMIEIVGVQPKLISYGTTLSKELTVSMSKIVSSVLKRIEEVCSTPSA